MPAGRKANPVAANTETSVGSAVEANAQPQGSPCGNRVGGCAVHDPCCAQQNTLGFRRKNVTTPQHQSIYHTITYCTSKKKRATREREKQTLVLVDYFLISNAEQSFTEGAAGVWDHLR